MSPVRVGPVLNNENWVRTVDNYGPIRNVGSGPYASLHAGKYDVDDTFRLEQFDPSILPDGQWQPTHAAGGHQRFLTPSSDRRSACQTREAA